MRLMIDDKMGITSDENNFVLFELKVLGEKSKNAGELTESTIGYYGTLVQALRGYSKYSLRSSEAKGLKEVLAKLDAIEKAIMNVKVK